MNEPPIASPFGPDETSSEYLSPPLPLKILVGIEMGRIGATWILALVKYHWSSPSWTIIALNALLLILYIFLLRGSKVSWWLFQLWSLEAVVYRIIDAFFYRTGYSPISVLFPDFISWMLLGAELTLFVYLFTPQARRFFYPPKVAS